MQRLWTCSITSCLCISVLLILLQTADGGFFARCREQPIHCFDCDSRYHPNCADPFNSFAVHTRNCQGCCTKTTFRYPDYYIVRQCANYGSTRIFDFDVTCEDRSGREKVCYCNDNLCNNGYLLKLNGIFLTLLTAITITCFNRGIISSLL